MRHMKYRNLCCPSGLNYKQIQHQVWRWKWWEQFWPLVSEESSLWEPRQGGPYTPWRLLTGPYWFGSTPVRPAMLANAIDKPSVLSRSVEARTSFSKTNQGRREGKRENEGRGDINGQWWRAGRRAKMQAQQRNSDPCPWFGNTKLEKRQKAWGREKL